jgi:hypothetical protein
MTLAQHSNLKTILLVIYCFVDDMIKAMVTSLRSLLSRPDHTTPLTKKHNLSIAELVTLALFRFFTGHRNWKDFYRHIKTYHKRDFPHLPTYQNFLNAVNRLCSFAGMILNTFTNFFRDHTPAETLKFADGSRLKVCEITRSLSHKVARGYATKSKTHTGWFFGC